MKATKRLRDISLVAALVALLGMPAWAKGPGTFKFDEASFEVIEESGMATIRVERSGGEDGAVSVDYATSTGGSATAGTDYTAVSGTLTWADDDGADRTFVVPITDDSVDEGAETIELVLSNPTGGAAIDSERGTSELVIRASDSGSGDDNGAGDDDDDDDGGGQGGGDDDDDDGGGAGGGGGTPGSLKFDELSFEVLESAGVALVRVERSEGETGEVSVEYSTSDGSAVDGEDYTGVSGTLTWFSGDSSDKSFAVPILDDDVAEGVETINLELVNPTGGAEIDSERGTAVIRILANDEGGHDPVGDDDDDDDDGGNGDDDDDDGGTVGSGGNGGGTPGIVKFGSRRFQALESGGVAIVAVERSHGDSGAISVDYETMDDTALNGEDYTGIAGTLTWEDGDESDKTLMVPIVNDDQDEGNETVALVLSNPTGGADLDPVRGTAELVIIDDDSASCGSDDDTLCLQGGRFRVEVEWRNPQGKSGAGRPIALSDQSGLFWFFSRDNVEMLLKVLDACHDYDAFWVFFAATTNVEFDVTVTDTKSGVSKTYHNPAGQAADSVQDTGFFHTCG